MTTFIWICLILVILSIAGLLYRVFRGPSIPDRLIALDAIGVMLISAIALIIRSYSILDFSWKSFC